MTNIEEAYAQWRDRHDEEPPLREAFEAGARVQPPTRVQAAAEMYAIVRPTARFAGLGPGGQALYLEMADAVLALFPQPTPSAECARWELPHGPHGRCKGRPAQIIAAPPSIADMAPGTTFMEAVPWTVVDADAVHDQGAGLRYRGLGTFDPSTIRDITPPPV